jgi:O-antigen ligase
VSSWTIGSGVGRLRHEVSLSVPSAPDAVVWSLLYVFFLYAIPSRLVIPPLGSAGAISMLVGLASIAGWGVYQLSRVSSTADAWQARPVRRCLVAFWLCVGISYVVATTRPISTDEVSPALVAILAVLAWSGILLVVNDGVTSMERIRVLTTGVAQAGGVLALVGLAQFATGDPIVDRISIPGLASAPTELFMRDGFIRPFATATHPIEFGVILAMLAPVALHSAFHGRHRNVVMQWFPVAAIAICFALTFSRSAYIAGGVALLILLIGWPRRTRKIVLIGMACMGVVLAGAVPRLFGVINAMFRNVSTDPSIASRTESYDLAWSFVANAPLFGRGLGTFLPKYRIFDNEYLVLLVSVGFVGTVAFVALIIGGIWCGARVYFRASDPAAKDLGLTLVAALLAGGIGLATFDGFAFPMTMGTLFLLLGLAGAAHRIIVTPKGRST